MKTINYVFQLLIRKSRVNSLITLVTLSIALVFSFNSVATTVTGTYFDRRCVHYGPLVYEDARRSIHIEPDNSRYQYYFGVVSFCLGYKEDALRAFRKSSNLNNPFASLAMARYYLTDGTWRKKVKTKVLKNLIESTAFYERARIQIAEYGDAYPPEEFKIMEGMTRASIVTTALPSSMLFSIYAHLVINTVKEEPDSSIVSSITATALDTLSIQEAQASSNTQLSDLRRRLSLDNTIPPTIAILKNMQLSAQSCLDKWQNQTSPTVWQEDYPNALDSVHIICESYVVFAKNSLPLEEKRLAAVKSCEEENINECDQYNAIVNELVDESYVMGASLEGHSL